MCGIAGIWGNPDEEALQRAIRRLRHRGPDSEGVWVDPARRLGLAHTRLSIIDLPGGGQPIFNEDHTVAVVFNGEIYNYVELRDELIVNGHAFATRTDTEVLVHLYEDHGVELVERLRGMFAFAIWDQTRRRLLLVRDRLGVKPLYYSNRNGLRFASEIKGLRALADGTLSIDDQAMSDYLAYGHVPSPATIYREIRTLPPGMRLVADQPDRFRVERYWRVPIRNHVGSRPLEPRATVERVESILSDAVRIRLRADVPVGAFLSGGIDSGLVVAMAARHLGRPVTTLSVGFEDETFDERPLARRIAERYGTDHHELLVRPNPCGLLDDVVAAYDQPYGDSSAIPSFCLASLARQHVKVVLNGDGGDEAFGGYRRFLAARLADRLGVLASRAARPLWTLGDWLLPRARGFRTGYAFARRFVSGLALPEPQRILAWGNDRFTEPEKRRLAGTRGGWLEGCVPTWRAVAESLQQGPAPDSAADRQMWVDAQTLLPDDLLVKMDIATMAHGLEARSPFLDHVLVEAAFAIPASVRVSSTVTKPILRELAARHLPAELASAPKRGFEVPLARWLDGELREVRDDLLMQPTGLLDDRFERTALRQLVRSAAERVDRARWARRVWTLMMLAMWDRRQRASGGWRESTRETPSC